MSFILAVTASILYNWALCYLSFWSFSNPFYCSHLPGKNNGNDTTWVVASRFALASNRKDVVGVGWVWTVSETFVSSEYFFFSFKNSPQILHPYVCLLFSCFITVNLCLFFSISHYLIHLSFFLAVSLVSCSFPVPLSLSPFSIWFTFGYFCFSNYLFFQRLCSFVAQLGNSIVRLAKPWTRFSSTDEFLQLGAFLCSQVEWEL